jgi:hypothetical protein
VFSRGAAAAAQAALPQMQPRLQQELRFVETPNLMQPAMQAADNHQQQSQQQQQQQHPSAPPPLDIAALQVLLNEHTASQGPTVAGRIMRPVKKLSSLCNGNDDIVTLFSSCTIERLLQELRQQDYEAPEGRSTSKKCTVNSAVSKHNYVRDLLFVLTLPPVQQLLLSGSTSSSNVQRLGSSSSIGSSMAAGEEFNHVQKALEAAKAEFYPPAVLEAKQQRAQKRPRSSSSSGSSSSTGRQQQQRQMCQYWRLEDDGFQDVNVQQENKEEP